MYKSHVYTEQCSSKLLVNLGQATFFFFGEAKEKLETTYTC